MSQTDAIMIGGTDDVTEDNVIHLMSRVRRYPLPLVLEISNIESVMPGFDFYFVPTVLNSTDVAFHNGTLLEALKTYGHSIDFEEVIFEGYVVCNADSKVAKHTKANTDLTIEDLEAYAQMVNHMYRLPVMYIEYSGIYGDVSKVQAVSEHLSETQLFMEAVFPQNNKRQRWQLLQIQLSSVILFIKILKSFKNSKNKGV